MILYIPFHLVRVNTYIILSYLILYYLILYYLILSYLRYRHIAGERYSMSQNIAMKRSKLFGIVVYKLVNRCRD